jgi:hypothetical protein
MKGFAQADWAERKAKNQQIFTLCPEWAEAESKIFNNRDILMARDYIPRYFFLFATCSTAVRAYTISLVPRGVK